MIFKPGTKLYNYEVQRESGQDVMYINYMGFPQVPSLADSSLVMARTVDSLIESAGVSKIVFVQQRNYVYTFSQVSLLLEVANLYTYLVKQEKILSARKLAPFKSCQKCLPEHYGSMRWLILTLLKQDPVGCYLEAKRILREEKINLDKMPSECGHCQNNFIRLLQKIIDLLGNIRMVRESEEGLKTFHLGDREIYKRFFRPDVVPNFTFTRLMSSIPAGAELLDEYTVESGYDKSTVSILKVPNVNQPIYHLNPPEFSLEEEFYGLIDLARTVMIEHRPKAEEFTDPQRTRQIFFNIARDLLSELAETKKIPLNYRQLNKLATILVRHTIGFGLVEVLLQDENLQDISINAPIGQVPTFVRHQKWDECTTNIIPATEDADAYAARFRISSGRPLDEANPVLDTDLSIENMRARVAIIQPPLSPDGISYAFRRHREMPWTLPLFVKNKMLNPITAGLLSFMVDGGRTILVAGTRSAGKTSLLGALMLEILPKLRVIVIEDSVTGDAGIIVKENGRFRKTTIGKMIDEKIEKNGFLDVDGREKELNVDNVEVFSVNEGGKVVLSKASKFIRHKVNKPIYEIRTISGKKVKVTEDHSLFTLDEKKILRAIKSKALKEGDFIAIPSRLPFENSLASINLLEDIDKLKKINKNLFVSGKGIDIYVRENRKELFNSGYSSGYKKSTIQNWTIKKILPLRIFEKIKEKINNEDLYLKGDGASRKIPARIELDEAFLNFIGLWLADGCYDQRSVIVSVEEKENKEAVKKIAKRFGFSMKIHSDKFSSMINSSLLREIMQKLLGLNGNSYTKELPEWAYNLSDKQAGALLKGFFSGDGCASDKEVTFSSCSKELIDGIISLLLRFGIVLRKSAMPLEPKNTSYGKDNTLSCRIGSTIMIKNFKENIGFLTDFKQERLDKLCSRSHTHDISDVIPLSLEVKGELSEILGKKFNKHDYIIRENNLGRAHLTRMLEVIPEGVHANPIDCLRGVVKAEIFWDKVKSARKVSEEGYVYDISVPGNENFVCENIVAHNTLEMPVDSIRKIGYNILRMKVRSALLKESAELPADEGIRTSLRLGDSCLIVGEVRSVEAKALYEAMRIGALANVVAGTIHGASPYAIFDRVVNDLGVPVTSFKATDIVLVANPIKSPDGLHARKRVVSLTEVRKEWNHDPLEEHGFVDLLKYNVQRDQLEPTADLINGDSEIIKSIAGSVRGWAGNWDAVWDNITLRAKIKEALVNQSTQHSMPALIEAPFVVRSNNVFHEISDRVSREVGVPEGKRVFLEWSDWLKQEIKRKKF